MVKLMNDVYTTHRTAAKNSMIVDYNLHARAQALREQFGGNRQ